MATIFGKMARPCEMIGPDNIPSMRHEYSKYWVRQKKNDLLLTGHDESYTAPTLTILKMQN